MCACVKVTFSNSWTLYLLIFILVSVITSSQATCSPVYGLEPCSFLPAPPGETPSCARPGQTYCEYPERYPDQRIKTLIKQWRFDHTTIISDESKDDFSMYVYPPPKFGYTNNIFGQRDSYLPEPIHIPKPQFPAELYNTPPALRPAVNFSGGFQGYPDRRPKGQIVRYKYTSDIPANFHLTSDYYYRLRQPFSRFMEKHSPFHHFSSNHLCNRNHENRFDSFHIRRKRSENARKRFKTLRHFHMGVNVTEANFRRKRQAALSGEPLCQTRGSYIMPRAALNNKGNWMYVVNMDEPNIKYTQLVKSETCLSQTCSSICGLPNGYTSKCEQKYVQKRLVALEGGGNNLYSDVFWFPSCCVCTISRN